MKSSSANTPRATDPQAAKPSGGRCLILVPVVFLLGVAAAGAWFKYGKHWTGSVMTELGGAELSGSTLDLLRQLKAPVEIRFYSILPPESAPDSLQAFSGRVDALLSKFQSAGGGKIQMTRNVSVLETNADAASADGIQAFNLEKGGACFLGIAVASGGQKESLPKLQPEWEPALEYDLARAILHVAGPPANSVVKASAPVSAAVTNEITRLIPDVNGTSLEDGIGILRDSAVSKINQAAAEMEKQIQAAQQQAADAQNGRPEAEQQAAMKHLQQVQLEQGEKIKAIAADLQAEISVFEQMKAAAAGTK